MYREPDAAIHIQLDRANGRMGPARKIRKLFIFRYGFLTVAYPIGIFANLLLPNIFTNDTLFYLGWLAKFVNYLMLLIIAALGTYTARAFLRGTTFKYHFISAEGE